MNCQRPDRSAEEVSVGRKGLRDGA